ncbi:hypothetical protein FQA39_LY04366 [Lamprigera yunnana]|nr:hypothetical protein FQA39_LY04366 [Lamprigera yunnana]
MLKKISFLAFCAFVFVNCEVYDLPKNVKPLHYEVTIAPELTYVTSWVSSIFWGNVKIQLRALENTKNITIHAVKLQIDVPNIKIVGDDGEIKVESAYPVKEDEIYVIILQKNLVKHQLYNLTISNFKGAYATISRGLFRATYGPYNDPKILAVTHFEPTYARYAFPCFDEPRLKATFVISIIRNKNYNSVSNEDLDKTEILDQDTYKDVFKETPLMSTYLVAFAVSQFKSTPRKERQRIYAQPKAFEKNEVDLPLELSIKTLKLLEEYTGINFTLSKMDAFAIPRGYFEHFGMENWGLVTYSEEYIRCNFNSSVRTLKTISTYISHEMAHQWFGNLVTHAQWDHIWLSESFAAYFQYFIASKVQPHMRLMDIFVIDIVQESFHNEKSLGSHGLNFRISRYGQFPKFHIMYGKGSAVVWMMAHFLTEPVFKKALHNYLFEKKFSSVVPQDLYVSVQNTVEKEGVQSLLGGMTISQILSTWDTFEGHPIVSVMRDYDTGEVNLTQVSALSHRENVWKIPINYAISTRKIDFSKTAADFWMVNKTMTVKLDKEGWLLLNKQHAGYYRVNYDTKNWERLIQVLQSDHFETIHVLNRAQLISDAFYLARYDQLAVDVPFRLAEYLTREKDYIPFAAFYNALSNYCNMYTGGKDKQEEVDFFLNHSLRNSVSDRSIGYPEHYLIFQMRTLIFVVFVIPYLVYGERYRLPKNVTPTRYVLTMETVLTTSAQKFNGSVVIELRTLESTYNITLHAEELDISPSSITVTKDDGGNVKVARTIQNNSRKTFTILLQNVLTSDSKYNLTISSFVGKFRNGEGFFLGVSHDQTDYKLIAGTHFQPKSARKVFPCFDEPALKASFIINLIRTADFYTLSNQELNYVEHLPNGRYKDVYRETPIMSTYIVAFCILNYNYTKQLGRHRMYGTKNLINALESSLALAELITQYFESYFGIPYGLPKLDEVAVPNPSIADNAMENWGLILYREKNIIHNDILSKRNVLSYMSHEISHQWLGNLVTPENFDYLWLSEGLATYFQFYATSKIEPSWKAMDLFVIESVQKGFTSEEDFGDYPLNYELSDDERFPPFHIIYEKASSILHMMVHFMTEEVFRNAVRRYLFKNRYNSVVPQSWYDACQQSINDVGIGSININKIMNSWDSNPGYPVVTAYRNYGKNSLTLEQTTLFKRPLTNLWYIPINYVHSSNLNFENTTADFWLTTKSATIKTSSPDGWVIFNKQLTGRYRVNYDAENWKRLTNFLLNDDFEKIHVLNRAQLLQDAFYLSYKKLISVSIPLTMSEYLRREKDYVPFAAFYSGIVNYIRIYHGDEVKLETDFFKNHRATVEMPALRPDGYSPAYLRFKQYIQFITINIRKYLGPHDKITDTYLDRLHRKEIDRCFPFYFL